MMYRSGYTPFVLALVCCLAGCQASPPPPNVVFILVDDLGWVDTGVYGSPFYETPHIDRLAADGVRFTQFYTASPVCSPTRASLMTGKNPARLHLTNWIGGEQKGQLLQAEYRRHLPLDELTFGEAFQAAGYTTGYIGKWHLGAEGFMPDDQGFDVMRAVNHAGQPGSYFPPYQNDNWPVTNVPDLDGDAEGAYLTDRLTDQAVAFLDTHRSEPFLLVLSQYAVHTPLQAPAALTQKYETKAANLPPTRRPTRLPEGPFGETYGATKQRQDHPAYAAMVERTDASVGRVLDKLDDLGLADQTLVVFVSDNGGLSTLVPGRDTMPTANLPLRAGKGWLYEGGIRAPLIVSGPGLAQGVLDSTPTLSTDLYPTLLALADLPLRPEQHQDGVSLAPRLYQTGPLDRDTLYWHFPHYHGSGNRPSAALRAGNFKLIAWLEDDRVELYNLQLDQGEAHNLAAEMPARTDLLRAALFRWLEAVDAQLPTPNPAWRGE